MPTLALWLCCWALTVPARADDSPKYAERGVTAYRAGNFELARVFFHKALQDAVLKGREEWVAKAIFNLVDLELETMEAGDAASLLEELSPSDRGLRSLVLWKRSQLAFLRRRDQAALALVDSALALAAGNRAQETPMRLDRWRYRIHSQDPPAWEAEYAQFRKRLSKSERERAAGLDAAAWMRRGNFLKADSLWKAAAAHYRSEEKLAKVAACMNQQAICMFSAGRRAEALEINARAVGVYGELGLVVPGLRAQALRLLLVEDGNELAKLRRDMDLVGQRFDGFDLQGILDEYAQSLNPGRPGPQP